MEKINTEIDKILNLIYDNKFNANDLAMLFIYSRQLKNADKIIVELGDFIAHSDTRIKGTGHNSILKYIVDIIDVSNKSGTIVGNRVIFHKTQIILSLIDLLEKNRSRFDKKKFVRRESKIIKYLFEKLDNITFEFQTKDTNNIKINFCYLKNNDDKISFCFNVVLEGKYIKTGPGMTWCNTLID
jgi:hypothetical protein